MGKKTSASWDSVYHLHSAMIVVVNSAAAVNTENIGKWLWHAQLPPSEGTSSPWWCPFLPVLFGAGDKVSLLLLSPRRSSPGFSGGLVQLGGFKSV